MKSATKYRILILIIPLLVGMIAAIGAGPKEVKRFYEFNRKQPLSDLKRMGDDYVLRGETDSAMACFSIIINAYSPSLTDEEKKSCASAFNNAGYIYFMNLHDYTQAYYYLIRALEIAEECGYTKGMSNIYLNMGNVFANYGDPEEATDNYLHAMKYALASRNYENYLIGYANLLTGSLIGGSIKKSALYAASLDSVSVPDGTPLLASATLMRAACRELMTGNPDKADKLLEEAAGKVDSRFTRERFIQNIQEMRAWNMISRGRYKDAAEIYKTCVDMSSGSGNYDLLGVSYTNLSDCYTMAGMSDSAVFYRNKRYEVEDSLYSNSKYSKIKKLQASYRMKKTDEEIKDLVRKRDTQRLVIAIVSVGAAVALVLLVFLLHERRRLRASNEELYNRVEDLLRTEERLRHLSREELNAGNAECSCDGAPDECGQDIQERRTLVDRHESDAILAKVMTYLESSSEIFTPGFSIDALCAAIDCKTRYVSYVINDRLGKNFNTLISEYRIREACRRLSDPASYGNITIEGVGISLGFRSRSNFAAHFKKQTGLSPNEFQKIAQKKARQTSGSS